MRKFKIAFVILLVVTLAFIGITAYCYVKVVVYAPEKPEPYYENGIWHDPSLSELLAYSKAKQALQPFQNFLEYSWLGIVSLGFFWIILAVKGVIMAKRVKLK